MNWTAEELVHDFIEANRRVLEYEESYKEFGVLTLTQRKCLDTWRKQRDKIVRDMELWAARVANEEAI